jgi:hypothetical protein|tara:strand:- start:62331 stop:62813 length:483 start_codon:yes stop_codon:yes gene_type:complete
MCDSECSICLEDVTNKYPVLSCGHIFHYECINEWKKISKNCPNCRNSLSSLIKNKRANREDLTQNIEIIHKIIKIIFKNSLLETKICIDGEYILYEILMDEYLIHINRVHILYRGLLYMITITNYSVKPVFVCCINTKKHDYALKVFFHTGDAYMMHFQV